MNESCQKTHLCSDFLWDVIVFGYVLFILKTVLKVFNKKNTRLIEKVVGAVVFHEEKLAEAKFLNLFSA